MKRRCLTLDEYATLHKSLLRLYGMNPDSAIMLTYDLYTANVDTILGQYHRNLL